MKRYPIIICARFYVTAFEGGALQVDIDGERHSICGQLPIVFPSPSIATERDDNQSWASSTT
jgi:hypothetical protein